MRPIKLPNPARISAVFVLSLLAATSVEVRAEVPTVRIEARTVAPAIAAEATIEAVRQSTLAAQMPGRILELYADAGDRVRKGALLVRIDPAEGAAAVAAAEAGIAQAESVLANARAEYQRARSLVERKFLSQSALDNARAQFQAAEAQARAARAQREQAATVKGYASVVSPLDGLVAARHIEPGEMAQPGRNLLTVYDPAQMRAVADLAPQRLAELGAGPLRASVELPASGRVIEAAAVSVLPAADARTHTVRVRVDLPADVEDVLPGSFARVHFHAATAAPAAAAGPVVIPAAAVLRRGELTAVYAADGQGGFIPAQRDDAADRADRVAAGIFATLITPREEEPQINVTMANVFVPFPGASARDVEALVARPAEQVLSRIAGIEHVYSVSRPGMAVITVQFEVGEDPIQALVRLYDTINSHADWLSPNLGVGEPHRSSPRASTTCPSSRSPSGPPTPKRGLRDAAGGARRRDRPQAHPRHARRRHHRRPRPCDPRRHGRRAHERARRHRAGPQGRAAARPTPRSPRAAWSRATARCWCRPAPTSNPPPT
jgi:RND family efflux transporter MFP subunit